MNLSHAALALVAALHLAAPAMAEDEPLIWRNACEPGGDHRALAGAPEDPTAFFRLEHGQAQVLPLAAPAGGADGRFLQVRSADGHQAMLESERFDGLVRLINALPPGDYDFSLDCAVRQTGRHVRKLTFQIATPEAGKDRWSERYCNPEAGAAFSPTRVRHGFRIVEPGAAEDAWDIPRGGLKMIRLTHWIGADDRAASVGLDNLAVRSASIHAALLAASERLVDIAAVTAPETLFMYRRGQPARMALSVSSLAPEPVPARLVALLRDLDGTELVRQDRELVLEADAGQDVDLAFDTADHAYGVYRVGLEVQTRDGQRVMATRQVQLGVCSTAELPKAAPGEFLYGLDTNLGPAHAVRHGPERVPVLLEWTRWMGADIVRGGFNGWAQEFRGEDGLERRLAEVERAAPLYRTYGLKTVMNVDPPDDKWAANMELIEQRQVVYAERIARDHADLMPYFEIGNEPDLPGFYEGPIERYARQYRDLYHAIKRGNPHALVMNGGFAYREDRIATFLETITPDEIDLIAYHAHGTGVAAERGSFRRKQALAVAHGYGDKTLVDTETGLAAQKDSQELEKARTCIEKMVFAQSQGAPFLLWFRLDMGNRPYGSLIDRVQPRPVVLAYRAMVETLRGHRFVRVVESDDPEVELYCFAQSDGEGRVLVAWSNATGGERTLDLVLGNAVRNLERRDLFGNPSPLEPGRRGITPVVVGEDPLFLCWRSSEDPAVVRSDPGLLPGLEAVDLAPGRTQPLVVTVRNPWPQPLTATLQLAADSATGVTLDPAELELELAPGERRAVALQATVGELQRAVDWPRTWTVFPRVDPEAVDLQSLTTIPETLPGVDGAPVAGIVLTPRDGHLDLAEVAGYRRHQDTEACAVFLAEVASEGPRELVMGAAADWWMAWHLDGVPLYDTLGSGNGAGYTILSHTFGLPLTGGRQLLAAKVLAGSHGWRLVVGEPEAVGRALGAPPSDRLQVRMRSGDEILVERTVPIRFLRPIAAWTGDVGRAVAAAPDALLGDRHVTNLWERVPGEHRWWGGDRDLSAELWLRRDAERLHLVVRVRDDVHREAPGADLLATHDGLALAIAGDAGSLDAVVGAIDGRATVAGAQGIAGEFVRDEAAGTTTWHLAIPLERIPGGEPRLNLRVHDNDRDEFKQHLTWRRGFEDPREPGRWYPLRLEAE